MFNKDVPSQEYKVLSALKPFLNFTPGSNYSSGIGDDAVVRRCTADERVVLTADIAVEEVHFSRRYMSLSEIGFRAMVSNISDCAAMGASVDGAMVQLVFPDKLENTEEHIQEIYRGFHRACRKWQFPIIGGDLSRGPQWVLAITLLGKVASGENVLYRSGAKPGDVIWVSGHPGQSGAGLEVLERFGREQLEYRQLIDAHVRPSARIELGRALAADNRLHAAIDISDGVAKESRTIAFESSVTIELNLPEELCTQQMRRLSQETGVDWRHWVLNGGEDYELLFTADPDFKPGDLKLRELLPLYPIGRCIGQTPGMVVRDHRGRSIESRANGYDHFSEDRKG
ncbi:MAG: thiamine-phosphate kinase [Chitinispirillaceae bacterium]